MMTIITGQIILVDKGGKISFCGSRGALKEKCPLVVENFIVTDDPSHLPDKDAIFQENI